MLKKITILLFVLYLSQTVLTVKAIAPQRTLDEYSNKELIAHYAKIHGSSPTKLEKVMICESGGNNKAWNKKDPGVGSKGLMQFQEGTFYGYAARVGIKNPDIWDRKQQVEVASWMFSKGLAYHWSCSKIVGII